MRRSFPRNPRVLVLTAVALTLSACGAARSAYETPTPVAPVQSAWTQPGLPATTTLDAAGPWWSAFGDPALDALVAAVLERNQDLAAAGWRLRQARAQANLAASRQAPILSGGANASGTRPFDSGPTRRSYDATLGVSYEVDLWGRLAAQTDAAGWRATATEEDLAATRLSLIGSTLDLYFQLAYLNERLALADANLEAARRRQTLVQARYDAGSESGLAMQEARESVLTQQAIVSQLDQQRVEARNALGLLLGSGHGAAPADEPARVSDRMAPVPDAGAPAELLVRRPDLRAAEARLRSVLADVDATRAGFYPTLSLTGSAGGASESLRSLLSNPAGTIAAALTLPFLDAANQRFSNDAARAGYEEARLTFQQTLITALSEVETALSLGRELAVQGELRAQALDAARRSETLNEVRYRAGEIALRDLLDSQDRRRAAEVALIDNRLSRLSAAVALHLALGGDVEG